MARTKKTKPVLIPLTLERAEVLFDALFEMRNTISRDLRLRRADPHPSKEDLFSIGVRQAELDLCNKLRLEVGAAVLRLKE